MRTMYNVNKLCKWYNYCSIKEKRQNNVNKRIQGQDGDLNLNSMYRLTLYTERDFLNHSCSRLQRESKTKHSSSTTNQTSSEQKSKEEGGRNI